jgi:tetratricopeptide (TPR) repeat protein
MLPGFTNKGDLESMRKSFGTRTARNNRALELQPDLAAAFEVRGAAYLNLREFEKSAQDGEKAISIDPQNGQAYYYTGAAQFQMGSFVNVIEWDVIALSVIQLPWKKRNQWYLENSALASPAEATRQPPSLQNSCVRLTRARHLWLVHCHAVAGRSRYMLKEKQLPCLKL